MAFAGRDLRIKYDSGTGAQVIAGARTDTLTINNSPIDITDKDANGVRTMLDDIGVKSMSMTVAGVLKDDTLIGLAQAANASAALHDFEITMALPTPVTYQANWFIASFEVTGEQEDATTFSMTLESSGAITVS